MRFAALLIAALAASCAANAETGSLTIYSILHAVGEERYELALSEGGLKLSATFEYTDRANKRTTIADLRMTADYTPLSLEIQGRPTDVHVQAGSATVKEDSASRTFSNSSVPAKHCASRPPPRTMASTSARIEASSSTM